MTHHGLVRAAVEHAAERAARTRLGDGVVERELARLDHLVQDLQILFDGVLLLDAELRVGRALARDDDLVLHVSAAPSKGFLRTRASRNSVVCVADP